MSFNNNSLSSKKRNANRDYLIDSDDEDEETNNYNDESSDSDNNNRKKLSNKSKDDYSSSSDTEEETIDAKRIRLAREYLDKISKGEEEEETKKNDNDDESFFESSSLSDDDDDIDPIGKKLAKDRLIKEGSYDIKIADKISVDNNNKISYWSKNAHDLSLTCIDLHDSGQWAYTGSKDHSVIMWDVERECVNGIVLQQYKTKKRMMNLLEETNNEEGTTTKRNSGEVLAVASSDDGRYVATGGRDALVKIFDVRLVGNKRDNKALIHTFKGHKDAITSLTFKSQSLQLFSGSNDRTIRHYNLEQQNYTYIETLYGHQQPVTSLSCYRKDIPLSSSRDRTIRAWKLNQETHFIYRGGKKAMYASDCLSIVNHDWFLTGHENGGVYLWNMDRKKPVAMDFHSCCNGDGLSSAMKEVVSCDVWKGSDFGLTGSYDGFLKLWKLQTGRTSTERGIQSIGSISVPGYINGIAIGPKAKFCLLAIGQEHRLGRWNRVKAAKNRIGIIPLR